MPTNLETTLRRGALDGLKTLRAICADAEKKDADRIAAAKALLDYALRREAGASGDTVRVVLDNVPEEYLA